MRGLGLALVLRQRLSENPQRPLTHLRFKLPRHRHPILNWRTELKSGRFRFGFFELKPAMKRRDGFEVLKKYSGVISGLIARAVPLRSTKD